MSAKGARGAVVATGVDLVVVVVVVMVVCAVLVLVLVLVRVVVVVMVVVLCVVVFLALAVDVATEGAVEVDVTGLPSQGRTTRMTRMHSLFTSIPARLR